MNKKDYKTSGYPKKTITTALPVWRKHLLLFFILLFTALIYLNSINNKFVNYDDEHYIQNNDAIKSLSFGSIQQMFTTFYFSNYHPLTTLSFALDYHFAYDKNTGKINAQRFHLINLLFHLLNVLLVFELLFLLFRKIKLSAIGALLFAIHPMHVESVSWISERKDVLYAFFYLLSAIAYLKYLDRGNKFKFIAYSFLFFLLSLLSKSMAVTLPVLLLLFDYYHKERRKIAPMLAEKIPFFVLSVIFGILAIKSQQSSVANLQTTFGFVNNIFLISYGLVFYMFKFVLPVNLSVFHPYPELSEGYLPLIYYLSLFILLSILIFFIFRKFEIKKDLIFGLLFFLITIFVVLQIIPVGQALVAERYTYIPYIGFIIIIIKTYDYFENKTPALLKKINAVFIALLCFYLVFFGYTVWNRNKVWKDSRKLWSDVVKKYPGNFYGYYGLGNAFHAENNFEEAIRNYDKSITLSVGFADAYYSRGTTKFKQNNFKGAIEDFNAAIILKPRYQEAYSNRGTAKMQLQDFKSAKLDFDKAIELNPKDPTEYYNRGNVVYYMQMDSLALADFNKAIALKPKYHEAYLSRGLVFYYMKNLDAACNDWNYALKLGNNDALKYLNQFCKH